MDKTSSVRTRIQELLPECVDALAEVIKNEGIGAMSRVRAFEALANRGGLPEVKATVTQSMTQNVNIRELRETRDELLQEQKHLAGEMRQLEGRLNKNEDRNHASAPLQVLPQPSGSEGDS